MRRPTSLLLAALAAAALAPAAAEARPRTPVVVVVLDELPLTSLLGGNGRIDERRYPGFAQLARESTWYPNATTVSDASKYAIPAILDGRAPKKGRPATTRGHPRNLFTLLRRQGYRLEVHEEATSLCPYANCRRRFGARYFLSHDRLQRFRTFISSLKPSAQPTLHYEHALLPHVPWLFLPSLRRYNRTVLGPIRGLNSSEISVFDRTLVRQSWQRHLLQVGAVDTLIAQMIAQMKASGLYDRAVLVVMSDHGISFRVGATDRRTIVPGNAMDIAPIPLFVKFPGQRRGRVSRSLARAYDVLPTIAARIGLRLPRGLAGRPAGSRSVRRRGTVSVLSRAPIGRIRLSRGRFLGLRRKGLRRKLALFGSGQRSLFDFGPNRFLLFRRVVDLPVTGAGSLRATLNEAHEYARVNPTGPFVPVHVTGTISGGRRRSRRDVAVAVNGFVRGVSRSVRLRRRRSEYYSVLVPESALRRGPNNVEVFAVDRTRQGAVLRRIYGRPGPS